MVVCGLFCVVCGVSWVVSGGCTCGRRAAFEAPVAAALVRLELRGFFNNPARTLEIGGEQLGLRLLLCARKGDALGRLGTLPLALVLGMIEVPGGRKTHEKDDKGGGAEADVQVATCRQD